MKPIKHNTFRHCRVRFSWTTFLETAVYGKYQPGRNPTNTAKMMEHTPVTGTAWLLIWTHLKFYERKSGEARSRKPSQPGWRGLYMKRPWNGWFQIRQVVRYGSRRVTRSKGQILHTSAISGGVVSGWSSTTRWSLFIISSPIKRVILVLKKSAHGCIKVATKG